MEATKPTTERNRGNSPRRFASALLGLLQGHVALFAEELKEQQSNTVTLLILTGLGLLFALLLIFGLSAALLIAFWDEHRLLVISLLCVFYALGLISCVGILLTRLRNAPTPFSASLEELARDREQLLP
ncbi:phage holin family protein [Ectopseudomonas mendocina]|uniref:Phage holin family protein n=1 Tax=Ectopseudomonas mendocina TaxID=300 RepID=A0ABZ2RK43_ECTME